MSYLASIDSEQDLTVMLVWGKLNMELMYQMTSDMDHRRPTDVLLVYRDIEEVNLPAEELRAYAHFANEALIQDGRMNLRTCVVVEDSYVFGITRQFGSVSEADDGTDQLIHYYTCRTMDEAAAWFDREVGQLTTHLEQLQSLRIDGIENRVT